MVCSPGAELLGVNEWLLASISRGIGFLIFLDVSWVILTRIDNTQALYSSMTA